MFGAIFTPFRMVMIGLVLATIAGAGAYVRYNESVKDNLRAENSRLMANDIILKDSLAQQTETIDYLQEQQQRQVEEFMKAESAFATTRQQNQELKDKLSKLQLSKAAGENPVATEKFVNDISNNINRCFEIVSGAPLTSVEKEAKNGNEFNPECPWLFTGTSRP